MNSKRPIRVAGTVDPPFAFPCYASYPEDCAMPGLEIEYIHTVINGFLQLDVEWMEMDSYNLLDSSVINGTADLTGISYALGADYIQNGLNPSPIMLRDSYVFIVREASTEDNHFATFKAFHWSLWLALFLFTAIWVFTIEASDRLRRKPTLSSAKRKRGKRAIEGCDQTVKHLRRLRDKVCGGAGLVIAAVLLGLFSNLLSIELIISRKNVNLPFNTFTQLHEKLISQECRFILLQAYENDQEFFPFLVNPRQDIEKVYAQRFRDAFEVNKPIYANSREELAEMVTNVDNPCLIGIDYLTLETYYNSRFCGLKFITELPFDEEDAYWGRERKLPMLRFVFYYHENAADLLRVNLDEVLSSEALTSYYDYLIKKYYKISFPPECKSRVKTAGFKPLALDKLFGNFILLSIGLSLATLTYLYEYIKPVIRRKGFNFRELLRKSQKETNQDILMAY